MRQRTGRTPRSSTLHQRDLLPQLPFRLARASTARVDPSRQWPARGGFLGGAYYAFQTGDPPAAPGRLVVVATTANGRPRSDPLRRREKSFALGLKPRRLSRNVFFVFFANRHASAHGRQGDERLDRRAFGPCRRCPASTLIRSRSPTSLHAPSRRAPASPRSPRCQVVIVSTTSRPLRQPHLRASRRPGLRAVAFSLTRTGARGAATNAGAASNAHARPTS